MDPDSNFLPVSSLLPDQNKNDIDTSPDEGSLSNAPDGQKEDMTKTLTQFAEQAKLEGSVYRKLLEELKKMANQIP